jgi:hypothetical protein
MEQNPLSLLLQVVAIEIQCIGVIVALTGFGFVIWQIRSGQKNALMSSFLSAVTSHWMLIEDRRMKIRSEDMKVSFRGLPDVIEKVLDEDYAGDYKAMIHDFVFNPKTETIERGKDAVIEAITREFVMQDHAYNLYEVEYIVGKYLDSVGPQLWNYWLFYIKENFNEKVVAKHWYLRKKAHIHVFSDFVQFVEGQCIPDKYNEGLSTARR